MKKNKKTVFIVIIIILIGIGIWQLSENSPTSTDEDVSSENDMTESEDTNNVLATVNGEEVYESDIEQIITQYTRVAQSNRADLSNKEVIDSIRNEALQTFINTKIMLVEAEKESDEISEEAIAEQFNTFIEQIGGQEAWTTQLESLNVSEDTVKQDIANDLLLNQFLEEKIPTESITVTEEEIKERYESAKTNNPEAEIPELSEVSEEIENQLATEKRNVEINTYILELREKTDISIL